MSDSIVKELSVPTSAECTEVITESKRKLSDAHDDSDREDRHSKKKKKDKDRKRSRDRDSSKKDTKSSDRDRERERKSSDRKSGRDSGRDRDRSSDRRDRDRSSERRDRDRRDRDRDRDRDRERRRSPERSSRSERSRRSPDRSERKRERTPDKAAERPDRVTERPDRAAERPRRERSRTPPVDRQRDKSDRGSDRRRDDNRSYSFRPHRGSDEPVVEKKQEEVETGPKPTTLREVMAANPGISMPEAVVRLNAYNTAVARGLTPSLTGTINYTAAPILPLGHSNMTLSVNGGMGSLANALQAGEGGALTKPHRELYVGNLPPGITVPQLAEFFNAAMKQLGFGKDGMPSVITAWVSPDGHYAFVEVRTVEEANSALNNMNGIQVGSYPLRMGRPKGYTGGSSTSALAVPMQASMPTGLAMNPLGTSTVGLGAANPLLLGLQNSVLGAGMAAVGLGGGFASDEPMSDAIMCSNLPVLLQEEDIRELFSPFGELKAFNVIKTGNGASQSAVFEYVDSSLAAGVVQGMNNLEIADCKLSVQRIPVSSAAVLLKPSTNKPPSMIPSALSSQSLSAQNEVRDALADYPASEVMRLLNMTTESDLSDDEMYNELVEDVSDECNTHGTVKSIVIPRTGEAKGLIFVHFVTSQDASKARKAVAGRKFNGKQVIATFYPEELFLNKVYVVPVDYFAHQPTSIGPSMPPPAAATAAEEEESMLPQRRDDAAESSAGHHHQQPSYEYHSAEALDTLD